MLRLYQTLIRPWLFACDSEAIHDLTLRALAWAGHHESIRSLTAAACDAPPMPVHRFGLRFPNPVGLAAGMDKAAAALPIWPALGFGFAELGGVTRHPQPGNPPPRMFRAVPEGALINRMGFNNPGADAFADALRHWRALGLWPRHPVGVNLGKSKITPLASAPDDYAYSLAALHGLADFFVVNVSSPNTPNLRQLQDRAALDDILNALDQVNQPRPKPLLIKVAPDLSWDALDDILGLALSRNVAGLVATNTTVARPSHPSPSSVSVLAQDGGLSGSPLRERSTAVIRHLYRQSEGRLPIVGVGGIFSAEDAWEKIQAGACLLQLYTGLVYRGPGLIRSILLGLREQVHRHGFPSLDAAVGAA